MLILLTHQSSWGAPTKYVIGLQTVLQAEESVRTKLSSKLLDALKQVTSSTADSKNKEFEEELNEKTQIVADAKNDIKENQLRIEFLNSLINKLEPMGEISDIKKVLNDVLIDLAHKQLISSAEHSVESNLWLFETYLAIAVRDIMEANEDMAEFIKKYIVYSSIREPRSPSEFLKERNYITP
ncbi:MAG: hypothetical protein IPM57_06870 [Oligoflexia bacterium]|nr:hypothetical protein [Oligoflexia bacterium]